MFKIITKNKTQRNIKMSNFHVPKIYPCILIHTFIMLTQASSPGLPGKLRSQSVSLSLQSDFLFSLPSVNKRRGFI